MKKILFYIFVFASSLSAQNTEEFTRTQEFYISGNTQVIGNNILSKHEHKAFHEPNRVNDEYKMRYVDIDKDKSTFSSSSAQLSVPHDASIVYAGLYWTATYPGATGGKRMRDGREVYKTLDDRKRPVEMIRFKTPQGNYQSLTGEIIYDGKEADHRTLQSRAPYVCFKDVTSILNELHTVNGAYTVANVSALEGLMSGGSSAGWMLYVIYERATDPLQYITTYHGFEFVNKKAVEVEFGNFRSSDKGEVETSVTIGALEGDNALKRDQVAIFNPEENTFISLDNRVRASDNFFNSSITLNDSIYLDRTPNSENTLGFDIAKLKIPNAQNSIIANNASGVKLQFKTRADRYFLFFTAFQTTISETFYKEISTPKPLETIASQESTPEPLIVEEPKQTRKITPQPEAALIETIAVEIENQNITPPNEEVLRASNSAAVIVPDLQSGYYIVTNVFSSEANAQKWSQTLSKKGHNPKTFLRPSNNLHYVYVDFNEQPEALYENLQELRKDEALVKSWMLKINL